MVGDDNAPNLRLEHRQCRPAPIALALYEPDIAANAGAMIRTCACLGVDVALIEPAGFAIGDRRFRRAAMDYLSHAAISHHASFERFENWRRAAGRRLVLLTTDGDSPLWEFIFRPGDVIMVGRESAGVPEAVAATADSRVRIPIRSPLRSLNVGIAAALALGEAFAPVCARSMIHESEHDYLQRARDFARRLGDARAASPCQMAKSDGRNG